MAKGILAVVAGAIGLVSIITIVMLHSIGIVQPAGGDIMATVLATIFGLAAVVLGIISFRSVSGKVGVGMGIMSLAIVSFLLLAPPAPSDALAPRGDSVLSVNYSIDGEPE